MKIKLKQSKKNSNTNVSRTNKTRTNKTRTNKFYKGGGSSNVNNKESLTISYPDIIINDNIDLTNKNYQKQPIVIINNAIPNKIYLVTMTDPDAPNGEGNSSNFVYTHWVYIQTKAIKMVYVPYSPPSPPGGIHRYQFNLYDITNKLANNISAKMNATDLNVLRLSKDELAKTDARKNYNDKLESFLKLNFKKLFTIQYKVNSNVNNKDNDKDKVIRELELKNKKLKKKQKK